MDLDPGTVVANRYRISRLLGRGGMGEVFAAENIRTGRPVAIKLLRQDSKAKTSAVARFRQEARAAGSINSDHVTQVLDVEEDPEHGVVLVFELLEGESLIERLKRTGPIPFTELWPIIEQVWLGLADAHRAGIVHRDLKPSNVFLERRPDGTTRVKILDFGISKVPKEAGGETLTEMGQSLGTFSFMPPEQIGKAKTVDHRADIYACTTLIYQSLTGQLPYSARNILVMVEMKTKTDARKLGDAMKGPVDPRLEAFVACGLARDPSQRFATAVDALHEWRDLRHQASALHAGSSQIAGSATTTPQPRTKLPGRPSTAARASPLPAPAPSIIESPGPIPRVSDLMETNTEETAATLAIPMGQAHERLQVGPGGTQLVMIGRALDPVSPRSPPDEAAKERPRSARQPPPPQGHATPSAPARIPSTRLPDVAPSSPPYVATTSDGQTQTRLYRPKIKKEVPRRAPLEPSLPVPVQPKRSASLVLVLIAFVLVGFLVVAIAMKVVRP